MKAVIHTIIVLAIVLQMFSCVFMGDSSMPAETPAGARGGE